MITSSPPAPTRMPVSAVLRESRLIAVLRADDPGAYDAVVDVLVESGVRSIELTLTTPGTLIHLPNLVARTVGAAEIGVGTVTTVEEAEHAIDAGASYLVTPVARPQVVEVAVRRAVPVYPGGLTPTELFSAWEAGATAVKIFPAETVGPRYGTHLRGPFPEIQFVPSGGVVLDGIADWLKAGAAAVSLGSPLVGDALRGGSLTELAQRATEAVQIAASVGMNR
ncbi:MAG: 2-dehydro-3-deoxyphosphogluconate aldolase [Microbacteriaceae bacterium]|nr:2-dehydro-3-deoxyphosphogluconate aldolase [Microbacteriaceae bacterium]